MPHLENSLSNTQRIPWPYLKNYFWDWLPYRIFLVDKEQAQFLSWNNVRYSGEKLCLLFVSLKNLIPTLIRGMPEFIFTKPPHQSPKSSSLNMVAGPFGWFLPLLTGFFEWPRLGSNILPGCFPVSLGATPVTGMHWTAHEISRGAPQPIRNAKFARGGNLSTEPDWDALQVHEKGW